LNNKNKFTNLIIKHISKGFSMETENKRISIFLNQLITYLFYISILLFFLSFNFQDSRSSGWYQQFLPNLNGASVSDVAFKDSLNGFAITLSPAYILKTTNGGNNWNIIYNHPNAFYRIQLLNKDTAYILSLNQLFKTTNQGINWTIITLPDLYPEDIFALNIDTIWAVTHESLAGGAFLSTNGGASWVQKFGGGTENPNKIYFYNSRIGFIKNNNNSSSLKKTTNGGDNWFPTVNEGFSDIFFSDSLTGWRVRDYVKKTTDGGLNWIQQQLPQGTNGQTIVWGIRSLSKFSKDTIWGTYAYVYFQNLSTRGIVYRTTNGGSNWYYQVPDTTIIASAQYNNIIFVNKNIGWAYGIGNGINYGIHTITGGDTSFLSSVNQINSIIPNDYRLYQNYPNPFNPTTHIKFKMLKRGMAELKIFDIKGKLVKILLSENLNSGEYSAKFDATGISSGVYFYSLFVNGERIDTKKAALIK
jgi:photosystem II stability/assembly factor-like uncharacterized protein